MSSAAVPPILPLRVVQNAPAPPDLQVDDPTVTKRRKVEQVEQLAAAPDDGASHDTTTTVARRDDVDEDVEEEDGTVSSFVTPPRCHEMKVGEPAIMQVWKDFLLECETIRTKKIGFFNARNALEMLCEYQLYYCRVICGCELDAHDLDLYCWTHGVSQLNIATFCEDWMIRKLGMSLNERRKVHTIMNKLTDFLHSKNYIDLERKKYFKSGTRISNAIDGDKIMEELSRLKQEGYWEEMAKADGHDAVKEKSDISLWLTTKEVIPIGEVSVAKVTERGWYLSPPYERVDEDGYVESQLTVEERNDPETYFLVLPPNVAKLGRKYMRISCVKMMKRAGGVLEPFTDCISETTLYGNVYPS